ncbi:HNH endonuclease [Fulvivirga ulvae]|uniref:RHS repeat-associated core domain-containing protein n=1 Tax=Fulvivirga ulvae TaxID=2904245 RepID=UPI001F1C4620|nr:RHS repeat-associated core domain-containing protein [Fulvivirga ulvae]UII32247.1 HNH endonuclease [Fulvivirga ulvae]
MKPTKFLIALLFCALSIDAIAQGDAPTQAPEAGFQLGSDITGGAVSAVNLFTGEVSFPLNLVSLPGQNGISPNVSISYNSAGVSRQAAVWNRDAPAGVIGLSWQMDFPKIIVDHKQTGTREDDDFYLMDGGVSQKLVLTRNGATQHYTTEQKSATAITYNPALEEWKVISGDGVIMTFGNKNSNRNTIQWVVKHGNWIGSSTRSTNSSSMAYIWNLSETQNRLGDKMTFRYEEANQLAGGKKQTETSYLSQIAGPTGAKINFIYADKQAGEYVEPHQEKAEPDAYQEVYQKRYLHHIDVINPYGLKLNTVGFTYELLGAGHSTKRLLTSIKSTNSFGETSPGIAFEYERSGGLIGKISSITGAMGGKVNYHYAPVTLSHSERFKSITAPAGYGAPSVWQGNNFVLAGWHELDADGKAKKSGAAFKLQAHTWDGRWISRDIFNINNVVYEYGSYRDIQVVAMGDYFAFLKKTSSQSYSFYAYHKDPQRPGEWVSFGQSFDLGGGQPTLMGGDNFVAVGEREDGDLHIITWDGHGWEKKVIAYAGNKEVFNYTAANNYIIRHSTYGSDDVELYHVNGKREWTRSKFPETYEVDTHPDDLVRWYASNSFAVLIGESLFLNSNKFIFNWDGNYNVNQRTDIDIQDNDAIINIVGNDLVAFKFPQTQIKAYRYDGGQWRSTSGMQYIYAAFSAPSYGEDIILYTDKDSGIGKRNIYNPNTSTWSGSVNLSSSGYQQMAGPDGLFYNNYKFYKRKADGTVSQLATTSNTSLRGKPHYGIGMEPFAIYTSGSDSYIQKFDNGEDAGLITLTGRKIDGPPCDGFNLLSRQYVNGQIIASYNGSCPDRATNLQLSYLADGQVSGQITRQVVSKVEVNDGYQSRYTAFSYTTNTAKADVSGITAQFNKARVIPGSSSASSTPYGYTDTYFFNGLSSEESSLPFPDEQANPGFNLGTLMGTAYAAYGYDKEGNNVSVSKTTYKGFLYLNYNEAGGLQYQSRYIRPVHQYSKVDGLSTETRYTYNTEGQKATMVAENYNSSGSKDVITTSSKYWWEAYDPNLTGTFLGPVVQTSEKVNNTTIASTATRWKSHTGKTTAPMPYRSYTWKGTGSPDFSAWNGDPSTSDWLITTNITERDRDFNIVSTKDMDDRYTTNVYDHYGVQVATVYNAAPAEVLCADFDDHDLINSSGSWTGTSHWQFDNGTMKFDNASQSANLYSNKAVSTSKNQIAEFDYKLVHGTGYLAYHFGKQSPAHAPQNSGYTVRIYSDAIKVYYTGTLLESYTFANDKRWHHLTVRKGGKIKVMLDGVKIIETLASYAYGTYDGIYATSGKMYTDNFRLYPEDAYATSTSFDKDHLYATASISSEGLITRKLYNSLGYAVASIGIDGTPFSTSAGYNGYRETGSFNTADPPSAHTTTIKAKDGIYEDFATDNPHWKYQENSNGATPVFKFENGELHVTSSGGATNGQADIYYLDMSGELTGNVGVEFDVRMTQPGNNHALGLALGGDGWDLRNGSAENAVWLDFSANKLQTHNGQWSTIKTNLEAGTTYRIKVVVNTERGTADYFVDGRLYLNDLPLRANTSGIQKVGFLHYSYGSASAYAVDNVVVYADPIESTTYLDAAGKVLQQQGKESDTTLLVSQQLYDALGRGDVTAKLTRVAGDFGYRQNFITNYNRGNGYMYGEVRDLNNDGYYPYSATRYETSPLGRVLEQSSPGTTYKLGSGKNGSIEYLTTSDIDLGYAGGKYSVVKTISPDGNEQITMRDLAGNVILEKAGPVTGTDQEPHYTNKTVTSGQSHAFSVPFSSEVSYDYADVETYKTRVKIGTTPGAGDIVDGEVNISGTFQAQANKTYYATVVFELPEPTLYYDLDCTTIIEYNPKYCFDENNCRILCVPDIVYYDYDCSTPIDYDPDYCFNAQNCRISCGPTPVRYYDYDCRTPIAYNPDYCFNNKYCRIMCPAPSVADARARQLNNKSYLKLTYADGKVWVDGHTIYTTTTYKYDTYGHLVKVYPPNFHNPPNNEVDRNAYIKTYAYDFLGRVKQQNGPDQGTTKSVYNENTGRLVFSKDGNGTISYLKYDREGRVIESGIYTGTWNESTLQSLANGAGPAASDTKARQHHTYESALGDDIFHRGELIRTTTYYEGNNDVVNEYFTYDRYGMKTKGLRVNDYSEETVTLSYARNNVGSLIEEVVPGLGTLTYGYDRLGRLIAIGETGAPEAYASYTYGLNGGLSREKLNNNSFVRNFKYDGTGKLVQIDDPYFREDISYSNGYGGDTYHSGLIARTTYNYKDITTLDGVPATYHYAYRYDKLGRLVVSDNSADNNWDIGVGSPTGYDPNGNILSIKKGSTQQHYSYYNNTNRVSRISGSTDQFSYDANGNITSSQTKQLSDITYDSYFNKPLSTVYEGGVAQYRYRADGERVMKTTVPADGSDTHYTLYVRGMNDYPMIEKERIDAGDWHTKYFVYGLTGLIASKTVTAYANAGFAPSTATFETDKRADEEQEFGESYRQAPIVNASLFNATKAKDASYALKLTGEAGKKVGVTKMLQLYHGDTVKMTVSAKYLKAPENNKSFVPAALAAELVQSLGIPAGAEGNLFQAAFENALSIGAAGLQADEKGVPQAFLNYIFFDKHMNPVSYGYKPITEAAYEDGTGRKHEVIELEMVADREGFAVVYVSNESREYSEVYFDDFSVQQVSVPQVKFYSRDHLGSTRVVVTASGTVDARYDYDVLGNIVRQEEGFIPNVYRYTGQEYDAETGLHNYRARFYDSDLGRFYAVDPQGQFHSPYTGIANNPANFTDPSGEIVPLIAIGIGAVIGGAINVAIHWNKIDSFGDGMVAFGIGAVAGAVGAATGGAAFTAMGGAAAGAGGFIAGSIGGMAGSAASMPIQSVGNTLYFGDPYLTAKDYAIGIIAGGLIGGTFQGIAALRHGKPFFSGELTTPSPSVAPTVPTIARPEIPDTELLPMPLSEVKKAPLASSAPKAALPKDPLGANGMKIGGGDFLENTLYLDEVAVTAKEVVRESVPTGRFYSVAYEMSLRSKSYPGISRYMHFKEANIALNSALKSNRMLSELGIDVPKSASGSIIGKSPSGWTWHHNTSEGVMQLVPKSQHPSIPGGIFWETMHPGGVGGYSIWGK